MRLIDADKLKVYRCDDSASRATFDYIYADDVEDALTIDLVRCGECKWCEEKWDSNNNCPTWECKNWFGGTDYDGYCHEGERRADEHNTERD